MWPYWLMLLVPAWGVLTPKRLPAGQARWMWIFVGALFALMMGLRHEVGGDWWAYVDHFNRTQDLHFIEAAFEYGEPGYYGLSWLVARFGADVHFLNVLCAALLAWGTVAFARRQPAPWLALFAAVPYLLIVVGMGYTRQSAAIGCAMLGLIALGDGRNRQFVAWVLLAATFHKTAVLLLPVAALAATQHRAWTIAWVGAVSAIGAWLFVYDTGDTMYRNYVESDYAFASQGAGIRVAMNVLPAVLYLLLRRRLSEIEQERKLWTWLSLFAVVCVPLLSQSPTAVDRMALYLIPLQLFVFGRLTTLVRTKPSRTLVALGVVCYYTAVQFVWLNFADTAFAWLPYQMYPLAG